MYRFLLRPKWLAFHLLVIAAIVTMVNLGFWQLRRLDERQAFNATIEERYDAPAVPLDDLLTDGTDPASVVWRPVTAAGTYLGDQQIVIVNRSQGGRAGENVVTPMRLPDGRILLVNRGFIGAVGITPPPPPADEVSIVGRLRQTQERSGLGLGDPAEGALTSAQRVDVERLAPQLPGPAVPMYVDLIESQPPEAPGGPEPVAAPTLGEGNHLSYAFQWFIFSLAVAVGWMLAVRRSAATRRMAST